MHRTPTPSRTVARDIQRGGCATRPPLPGQPSRLQSAGARRCTASAGPEGGRRPGCVVDLEVPRHQVVLVWYDELVYIPVLIAAVRQEASDGDGDLARAQLLESDLRAERGGAVWSSAVVGRQGERRQRGGSGRRAAGKAAGWCAAVWGGMAWCGVAWCGLGGVTWRGVR